MPLLSIIIPTKNRHQYLFLVLKTIVSFKLDNIEIVVQDNSDDGSLICNYISENKEFNGIVKYFHSSEILSQAGNSELAVKNSTGEYLCFIGDDDCVTNNIVQAVLWMKAINVDVLITNKPSYVWQDLQPKNLGESFSGMLVSYKYTGSYSWKKSEKELNRNLNSGGQKILDLPQFYHNIVKREILNHIYAIAGTYFPGPSPDMACAVALTAVVRKYVKIDYPLILSGQASGSVGGMGAKGKHIGEIKDIPFLPNNTAETWSQSVPFYWSGSTIYADSVLKALKALNKHASEKRFNYNYLYAHCYIFDKDYRDRVVKSFKNNKYASLASCLFHFSGIWALRLRYFFLNRMRVNGLGNRQYFPNIGSIDKALELLEAKNKKVVPPWNTKNNNAPAAL